MRPPQWIGKLLAGKYRVERVVGEGGMGVVLEVIHTELEERFAIKVLHGATSPELARRFLREGKATAKIRSEHIVRVHDVGKLEDETPYLVMELLVGEDLELMLERQGPLSVEAAVDYVLQACDALAEAHGAGIVHRDVKPSNLFLTHRRSGAPCIKVLDFGISKLAGEMDDAKKTGAQDIFGSPLYMSPEALLSTRDVDPRADVWALGIVLFELLTGEVPFNGDTPAAIHLAIVNQTVPDVRQRRLDVPPALMSVISAALTKDREARIPSVAALAEQLAPFATPFGLEALQAMRATTPPGAFSPREAASSNSALHVLRTAGAGSSGPYSVPPRLGSLPTVAAFETHPLPPTRRWWIPATIAGFLLLAGVGIGLGVSSRAGKAPVTAAAAIHSAESPAEPPVSAPVVAPHASEGASAVPAVASVDGKTVRVGAGAPPKPKWMTAPMPSARTSKPEAPVAPTPAPSPSAPSSPERSRLPDDRR